MAFEVEELAIELIGVLRPLVGRVQGRDPKLADQVRRAASSVALNIGEANRLEAGNRRQRFITAAGSASEVRSALRVAGEWRYFTAEEGEHAQSLIKRILSMLWKLTH